MKKAGNFILSRLYEWPSAVSLGVAIAIWFSFFLTIGYHIPQLRGTVFFSGFPANTRFILGIILIYIIAFAFIKPTEGGLSATYIICMANIVDSIIVHQYARIAVWFLILLFGTWGVFQKSSYFRVRSVRVKK